LKTFLIKFDQSANSFSIFKTDNIYPKITKISSCLYFCCTARLQRRQCNKVGGASWQNSEAVYSQANCCRG